LSEEIVEEYREVTARPKFASLEPIYSQLISLLETVSMYVDSAASSFSLPDSDDEMYLSAAIVAVADVLVTGNKAHFPEEQYENTSIVTPRQFLERVSRDR
jgi:predicted nucleic acid-binding protein